MVYKPRVKTVTVLEKHRRFNDFLKVDEALISYERFDGQMSEAFRHLHLECVDAVAAVIYNPVARRAVLVNQFRYATHEKGPGWLLEVVAGKIDGAEAPEAAIRREVMEETGYTIQALEPISVFYLSPGISSERIHLFYAEVSDDRSAEGGGLVEEVEDILTVSLGLDELEELLPRIHDAKTLVGVQWLLRRFKR